jgi:hypothetical protein
VLVVATDDDVPPEARVSAEELEPPLVEAPPVVDVAPEAPPPIALVPPVPGCAEPGSDGELLQPRKTMIAMADPQQNARIMIGPPAEPNQAGPMIPRTMHSLCGEPCVVKPRPSG